MLGMPVKRCCLALSFASLSLFACRTQAPSEEPTESTAAKPTPPPPPAPTQAATPPPPASQPAAPSAAGPDPLGGKFTLADATKGLAGKGPIMASIDTSMGKVSCRLYDDKAPNTVANFVGLATGKRPWLDPNTNTWSTKPAYDGTTFHRVIKGFMIQGGDPKGNGSGEPGYTIPDEMWPGAKHDRAGLLCMANRGPNTNGAQFFITESDGPSVKHLDGFHTYTIFGECDPVATVHAIATTPTAPGDRPITPVVIKSVTISR
jgi:peptidyl-prolyl cis-trans isomerase A (cyclophilin A)